MARLGFYPGGYKVTAMVLLAWCVVCFIAGAGFALIVCVAVLSIPRKRPQFETLVGGRIRMDLTHGDEASLRALRRNALRLATQ